MTRLTIDLEFDNADLRMALELLKRGSCWCEMAIGNPMVKNHSEGCKLAQRLMEGKE